MRFRLLASAAVFPVLAVFSFGAFAAGKPAGPIELRWKPDAANTNHVGLEVTGLPSVSLDLLSRTNWSTGQWQELISITIETSDLKSDLFLPPMAGRHEITNGLLRYIPAFPVARGVRYRASFDATTLPEAGSAKGLRLSSVLHIPAPVFNGKTIVTEVFPTASVLPENLLKFYVHFSAQMSRGHIYDHIHLFDADGKPIELPFLEIDEELWNPEMNRLTLFLDPGRIKRGVKPLEEGGPALEVGKTYKLVIDRGWLDATGTPLRQGLAKTFTIGPADREPFDPKRWFMDLPKRTTKAPVVIHFGEPVDHALLERMLRVTDAKNRPVPGSVTVGKEERSWSFRPELQWKSGVYRISVPSILEDLAGNNIGKPFDVDLLDRAVPQDSAAVVQLPFTVN